jgi:hypothetical protein
MENMMARKSIQERLSQLDAQRKTLQTRLGKQGRVTDTRRKILLGALVLFHLEEGEREFDKVLKEWVGRELPGFLTREDDKALFTDLLATPSASDLEEAAVAAQRAAPEVPVSKGPNVQADFLLAQKLKPDNIEAGA